MLPKIDRETLLALKRASKEGRKEDVDEALGFVICPQQVDANRAADTWTRIRLKGGYHWRVKAWMRDHCAGAFADMTLEKYEQMSDAELLDIDMAGGGANVFAFESPDDAFAFKMRWHGEETLRND